PLCWTARVGGIWDRRSSGSARKLGAEEMVEVVKWDGKKITRPCIVSDMSIDAYHSDCCDGPSASSSNLRTIIAESPEAYWDSSYLTRAGEPQETTKALTLGRAIHHLILGQAEFRKWFAQQPGEYPATDGTMKTWNNNAGYCKAWKKAKNDEGREVLSEKDVE